MCVAAASRQAWGASTAGKAGQRGGSAIADRIDRPLSLPRDNQGAIPARTSMTEPAPQVPDFETSRLRLRKLRAGDAPGLHESYGDPETMRFWDAPPSRDLAETAQRIERSLAVDPTWHAAWAVLAREDGRFLGMVNYHARQPWNRRLAIGWILVPSARGHGFMAEAVRAVLPHCFGALATHRIEAEIEPDNIRSARLADRLGFRREALLHDRLFVAGEHRSVWMHALLRPDWKGPSPA